ncbi:MAG: sugar ABC transporter permease [Clostridiales bacterium]|nr:sugar ABC transporter permease [Clostridiales bacterium]
MKVHKAMPYAMISGACALLLIFRVYPLISTVCESFQDNGAFSLAVYQKLARDSVFWKSMLVTLKLNIVIIPVQLVLSLALALLVNNRLKLVGVFRTLFFLPFTVSSAVACVIWSLLLSQNNGLVNSILNTMGIASQGFWGDRNQALWCVVVEATWVGCGYWMVFFLAGLKGIDRQVYESAQIDGAGYMRTLWSITLPLLKNVMLFVMVANTTSNLLLFTPMKIITNGGPMGSTNTLMFEAYKSAFKYGKQERSAAIVTVLLVLVAAVCALQFYLMRDRDKKEVKRA